MITKRNRDLFGPRRKRAFGAYSSTSPKPYAWVILLLSVALLVATTQAGWLMRSVILDVVSIWPLAALSIAVIAVRNRLRSRKYRTPRSGPAVAVPLALFIWVAIGVSLHLIGWGGLPSTSVMLHGPEAPDQLASASLDIRTQGEVHLDGEGRLLYEVTPMRWGGSTGPPHASDLVDSGRATISLEESADAGWYGSRGWLVSVSGFPEWDLTIRAPRLEADLTATQLQSLRVQADGRIRLGSPSGEVPIRLNGATVLEVPADVSIEIEGPADVGPEWEVTATGARYVGVGASRYTVLVEPGSHLMVEHG